MTGDPRLPTRLEPVDDAKIEQLVREVASGWTMPPVRLDAPSWRDRVRSPRVRRIDAARGGLLRVGQAATAAIALTVVGALVAVMLTRPPSGPGQSPEPSDPGSAAPPAAFTPLPKLLLDGETPVPSTVLTEIEEGDFALVDLAAGERGPSLTNAMSGSVLRWRADGTLMCLCVKVASNVDSRPTEAEITLDRFDAAGNLTSTVPVLRLAGDPDPRDGTLPERPPHLAFDVRFSDGGRFGFIGWSVRKHPAWLNGVTVIDLLDGHEVSRVDLPDDTTGEGDTRRVVTAPQVLGTGADGTLAIAREWYSWSPPESDGENYRQGTDVFRAGIAGGVLSDVRSVPGAEGCGERVLLAGTSGDGGSWLACSRVSTNTLVVRRLDADGAPAGDTTVGAASGIDGDPVALSPDRQAVFAWNPVTVMLTRVDLETGEATQGRGPTAAVVQGPVAAVGAWLAPPVSAKSFLYGGIVVSPDGTRVYAVGVNPGADGQEMAGVSGIFVFDAATLTSLGRWEPKADYISLGVSSDGRYVYAAGLPRVDASGRQRPGQQTSITVHSASDGAVHLIAGQLGGEFLLFPEPILD